MTGHLFGFVIVASNDKESVLIHQSEPPKTLQSRCVRPPLCVREENFI